MEPVQLCAPDHSHGVEKLCWGDAGKWDSTSSEPLGLKFIGLAESLKGKAKKSFLNLGIWEHERALLSAHICCHDLGPSDSPTHWSSLVP